MTIKATTKATAWLTFSLCPTSCSSLSRFSLSFSSFSSQLGYVFLETLLLCLHLLNQVTTRFFWKSWFHPWKSYPWRLLWLPSQGCVAPAAPGACLWRGSVAGPSAHCSGQLPSAWLLSSAGPDMWLHSPDKELIHCWWYSRRSQPTFPALKRPSNLRINIKPLVHKHKIMRLHF